MVFEVTLSNALFILGGFIAATWALVKVISNQQEKHLNTRFDSLGKAMADIKATQNGNSEATQKLAQELRDFQMEAIKEFVRRDDFVRHVGIIEARIDNYALRMERVAERLQKGASSDH